MYLAPICLFAGHKVKRRRVWNDGQYFRGKCRRCSTPMVKTFDGWNAERKANAKQALV